MTPLEISLKMLPAIIAILSLMLVFYVGKTYHPMTALHRTYIRIDGILHEKSSCLITKKHEDFYNLMAQQNILDHGSIR